MKTNVGVWIDHRKAVIVTVAGEAVATRMVISKAESQPRRGGDRPLAGSWDVQQTRAEDKSQRAYQAELRVYYDTVIASFGDAAAILILGPGEAKNELKKRLAKAGFGDRVAGVEAADKLTDRQLAAKVLKHFAK